MKLGKIIILSTGLIFMDDIDVMRLMIKRRTITFDVDNIWSMIRMMPPAKNVRRI